MEEMRSQDPAADCRECQTTAGTGGCDESHCDLFATCDKCCQLLCCCECWKECAECLVNSASRAPSFAACCTASELDLLCALCPQPVPSQSQPPLFPVPVRHPHFVHSHLIGASESGVSPMNIEWLLASPLGLGSTPPAFSPMQTPVYSADSPYQANTCGYGEKQHPKKRVPLTPEQRDHFEAIFEKNNKPHSTVIRRAANTVGIHFRHAQFWFQNRRASLKKQKQKEAAGATACSSPSATAAGCSGCCCGAGMRNSR